MVASLEQLIQSLSLLPGVGRRSARRFAYHLLSHKDIGLRLRDALVVAMETLKNCAQCNMISDQSPCILCSDSSRNQAQICVVESTSDIDVIEKTDSYRGFYFVLSGHISPMEGIGPLDLFFSALKERVIALNAEEVVVATSFTHEGELTAHYLSLFLKALDLSVTRIARGIPVGGEIEHIDIATIIHSFKDRYPL